MGAIKQLLNFYINSSIHVALAVCALTWTTFLEFQVPIDKILMCFIFFASVTGYNFVKYFGLAKFHHRRLANWLKAIQVFSFFCFLLMVYYAVKLPVNTLLYTLGFGAVTFFYAIPFLPKRFFVDKQQNLRSIGGLKIYLIAFVWTGVTVFIPLINDAYQLSADVFITGFQRYIYVVVLMLPFEIRDLRFDNLKLSTIPQKIGVPLTKIIGALLLFLLIALELLKTEFKFSQLLIITVMAFLTWVAIKFSETNQGKYYSSFWVEGLPLLWLLLMHLFI
ncbi:UbiA prenyltransferase family protein [Seonamhaeicola aphaedonensis]|uniref:UbiA prenyltransferase family protein n=1 Tax=Seonamhaeicola aphaedonensis TaxID=1461338 RepID=A0A3D9HG61_9FLAO|nr:hypothetical protein [Seonamhaeicola aphaedonensis]RED48468.1 hypothetical protein DFQ02_104314 [Seonamhaeicola aphaedonensis]